jgi:predicted nucleic acid-binding protein
VGAAVIDTNVFAYAFLFTEPCWPVAEEVLRRVDRVLVPDSVRAELANAVWTVHRAGLISLPDALGVLDDAEGALGTVVSSDVLWREALELSAATVHPVYDTLFVALARRHSVRVVTFDQPLRRKFPDWTIDPGAFLASLGESTPPRTAP